MDKSREQVVRKYELKSNHSSELTQHLKPSLPGLSQFKETDDHIFHLEKNLQELKTKASIRRYFQNLWS